MIKENIKRSIIILNGPSGSGKSTLARELCRHIYDRYNISFGIASIDDCLSMSTDREIWEEDVYNICPALCEKVNKILAAGKGVIIDHVITSKRIFDYMTAACGSEYLLVKVTCSPDILIQREEKRGDRCPGTALASYDYLYPKDNYDVVLDTGKLSAEECASELIGVLEQRSDADIPQ